MPWIYPALQDPTATFSKVNNCYQGIQVLKYHPSSSYFTFFLKVEKKKKTRKIACTGCNIRNVLQINKENTQKKALNKKNIQLMRIRSKECQLVWKISKKGTWSLYTGVNSKGLGECGWGVRTAWLLNIIEIIQVAKLDTLGN